MSQPSRSLIAEPPLLVLPSLAVAVGVNQAILLQQFHFLSLTRRPDRHGQRWVELGNADLLHTFPFWSRNTVWRMVWQLRDGGLLTVKQTDGAPHAYRLEYAAIDQAVAGVTLPSLGRDPAQCGDGTLPNLGRPTIKEVSDSKRSKYSAKDSEAEREEQPPRGPAPLEAMTLEWLPDETTRGVIFRMGIPKDFIDTVLPEFRLYWLERACAKPWGAAFVSHVRRQWTLKPTAPGQRPGYSSDRPRQRPEDLVSGKQPDAAEVLAKSRTTNPATPEAAQAAMDAIKKELRSA
jgi:hypothetical protein